MYQRPRRLGCCSSGPAGPFGADDDASADVAAYLKQREDLIQKLSPPADASGFPTGKVLTVSVLAGLTVWFLTKR